MNESRDPRVVFAPALAVHLLTVTLMAGAVAWSIAQLIGWWVAMPIGIALTYVFSMLAKRLTAPRYVVTRGQRVASGIAAIGIFAVTVSLSYGSLYATLFAETSALTNFAAARVPLERALEQAIANAQTAQNALRDWSVHSRTMRDLEQHQGGSCPAKPASLAIRGGIARWRDADALTASTLSAELASRVTQLRQSVDTAKALTPTTFRQLQEASRQWNAAVEMEESLARGAYIKAAKDSLTRQLAAEISWPRETFRCGDTARDELIERALSALKQIERGPALQPLAVVIDLSNRQDIAGRGMIRGFNMILKALSFGAAGSFVDDALMVEAVKKGLINRETLPFALSALLELSVLLTGALVHQRRNVVFPYQPVTALTRWSRGADELQPRLLRIIAAGTLLAMRTLINLVFAEATNDGDGKYRERFGPTPGTFEVPEDPVYPDRTMSWGNQLLPYWVPMHGGDYLVIPNTQRCVRQLHAARALCEQGATTQLHFDAPFPLLSETATRQMTRLLPDARGRTYAIFKISPSFAQALRIRVLEGDERSATLRDADCRPIMDVTVQTPNVEGTRRDSKVRLE